MTISALIVDDIRENRQHFQRQLMELGTYILQADSAEEALEKASQANLDVVFLDYSMEGGMNGFEFVDAFRQMPGMGNVKIVMMSSDIAVNQQAVQRGIADAWVVKSASRRMVEDVLLKLGVLGQD